MLVKTPLTDKTAKKNRRKQKDRDNRRPKTKSSAENHGNRTKNKKKSHLHLPHIAPWKIIVGVILLGGIGILYLHHVFATQRLLQKVQAMEKQHKQAQRRYKKVRMKYYRLTGPVNITTKAKKMGFVNGGPAKRIIKITPE